MPLPNRAIANQKFTSSRQLLPGSWANAIVDGWYSAASILAAGTVQADAAIIDAAQIEVLVGSANNAGVKLPPAQPGMEISILNLSANTTLVYPATGEKIQNGATGYAAANASVSMATAVAAFFFCIKAGSWQVSKAGGP